jgi:hypothetical protein
MSQEENPDVQPNRNIRENPNKKPGLGHLKRAQRKAHFNFHKRVRDAEERKRLDAMLDSNDFDFDESPLLDRSVVADRAAKDKKGGK